MLSWLSFGHAEEIAGVSMQPVPTVQGGTWAFGTFLGDLLFGLSPLSALNATGVILSERLRLNALTFHQLLVDLCGGRLGQRLVLRVKLVRSAA